ncbi:MAG: VCBS repeat-containing protein, partial [Bacteroidota bacterium]
VTIADLNDDGYNDLVITKSNTLKDLLICLGDGTGSGWIVTQSFNVADNLGLQDVVVADFDGDNIPDVITSAGGGTNLYFMKGHGDGMLEDPIAERHSRSFDFIISGDLNNDGRPDLVLNSAVSNSEYDVLLNTDDGEGLSFVTSVVNSTIPMVTRPSISDVDHDGNQDLVFAEGEDVGRLGIMSGNGDGSFQTVQTYQYPEKSGLVRADGVGIGDYNADGKLDFAVIDLKVWVYLNNTAVETPTASVCGSVLDFDGLNDYVEVPYRADNNTAIYSFAFWSKVEGNVGRYRAPVSNRDNYPQRGWMVYAAADNTWLFWQGAGLEGWQSAS